MTVDVAPTQALPRWVRVADAVAVAAVVLGAIVQLSGGFREMTPLGRLSLTSGARPVVFGVLLLVFRHWRHARPTIVSRVRAAASSWSRSPVTRAVLPPFVS